ncbi:MAG TPA: hypothetical protein VEX62_12425 [Candidatus Limnocylindrales bacterium]|nr:hypothetical protein [Candidatus Limnocylindrales bacterium]
MAASVALDVTRPTIARPSRRLIPLLEAGLVIGLTLVFLDSPLSVAGKAIVVGISALTAVAVGSGKVNKRPGAVIAPLVIGAIGLPISVGYAVARLVEGAWLGGTIGVLAGVAAAVLLGWGAVTIVRAATGWWRVAVAVAIVASGALYLQFVLMPLAAATLGVHPPRMPIAGTLPGARDVSFPTPDGARIGAWYAPSANGATVILLPGSTGSRSDTLAHASVLVSNGYGVLAVDSRGAGTSTDYGNMWGWTGGDDIAGAIGWLYDTGVPYGSIGLLGLSMGGEQAVTATSDSDIVNHVGAVVAEGVAARVPGDLWFEGTDPRATVARIVSTTMWTLADIWTEGSAPPTLGTVATMNTTVPVLVIAADAADERAVAADMAQRSAMFEVWQTSGIGHVQALELDPNEWQSRVIDFLDRELLEQ